MVHVLVLTVAEYLTNQQNIKMNIFNMVSLSMIGKNKYYKINNNYFLILMETDVYGQWIGLPYITTSGDWG